MATSSAAAAELKVLEDNYHRYDNDGKELLAIKSLERALAIHHMAAPQPHQLQTSVSGVSSTSSTSAASAIAHVAERIIVKYNVLAVRCFKEADFDVASNYLEECLRLTEPTLSAVPTPPRQTSPTSALSEGMPHPPSRSTSTAQDMISSSNNTEMVKHPSNTSKATSKRRATSKHATVAEPATTHQLLGLQEDPNKPPVDWQNEYFPTADQAPLMRRLRSTTQNNYGCLERRRGNLHAALTKMQQSFESAGVPNPSLLLNMSAIHSQLGKQDRALHAVTAAIKILEGSATAAASGNSAAAPSQPTEKDQQHMLAIAYHNLAMALENAPDSEACLNAYRKAYEYAIKVYSLNDQTPKIIDRNMKKYEAFVKDKKARRDHPTQQPVVMPPGGSAFNTSHNNSSHASVRAPHPPVAGGRGQGINGRHGAKDVSVSLSSTRTSMMHHTASDLATQKALAEEAEAAALLAPPPVDLTLSEDELRGVVSGNVGGGSEAVLLDTNTISHKSLKQRAEDAKRKAEADKKRSDSPIAPQPPTGKRGTIGANAPRRSGAAGRKGEKGDKGDKDPAGYVAPPRPIAPLDTQTLEEEGKKKEDLVGFVAQRLGQLLKFEEAFETRYQAAVKIQTQVRRMQVAKKAKKMKEQRERKAKLRLVHERASAVVVINFFRFLVRKRKERETRRIVERAMVKRRQEAVVKMQSIARMWLAKQTTIRLRKYYKRFFIELHKVQCWWRQQHAKLVANRMKEKRREATAEKLQLERMTLACLKIQSVYRRHRAAIAFLILKGDEKAALLRDWQKSRNDAALRIQRMWKGYLVRRVYGQTLKTKKKMRLQTLRTQRRRAAAIRIQAVYRGHRARHRTHKYVGEHCQRQKALRVAQRRLEATIKLQCFYRCCVARGQLKFMRRMRGAEAKDTSFPAGFQHPVIDLEAYM